MTMRANIVGPPDVAMDQGFLRASIASCHSLHIVLGLRKLRDVVAGIPECDELATAWGRGIGSSKGRCQSGIGPILALGNLPRTSAPRLPQAVQTKRSSISDSRT